MVYIGQETDQKRNRRYVLLIVMLGQVVIRFGGTEAHMALGALGRRCLSCRSCCRSCCSSRNAGCGQKAGRRSGAWGRRRRTGVQGLGIVVTVLLILVLSKVISRCYCAEAHMMSWRSDRSWCAGGSFPADSRNLDMRRPESSVSRSGGGGILGRGGYAGHGRIHPLRRWLSYRGRRRDLLSAIAAAIKTSWVLRRCRWLVARRMLRWRHWLAITSWILRCH